MKRIALLIILSLCTTALGEPRTYTQDVAITFATPEAAAAATLTPLPVLDGKPWALSARWDDNHPGSITMHDLMARHGLKGTFYVCSGSTKRFGQDFVNKLLPGGFSLGGHTQSHFKLPELNAGEVFYEILANRVQREAQSNQPMVSFAFPYGLWDSKDDPDAGWRSIEAVRRAGYHQIVSTHVWKGNPHIRPGEFSTTLLVQPGDRVIDTAKFNTNLEKLFKFPKPYQDMSHCVSLATHPWQQGPAWDDLDKLLGELKARADWWICSQSEYAAYERQVKLTKIERMSVSGATANFRITRPLPAELGADVPLTVETSGEVASVTGDAAHRLDDGKKRINLVHSLTHPLPTVIDAIDNDKNEATPAGPSKEFPGITAWLTADGNGQLTLAIDNHGEVEISDLHLTWRLPLAYEPGVRAAKLESIKPGQKREERCEPGAANASHSAGGKYYVAELDFRFGDKAGRLFATATVGQVLATPKPATAPATQPAADMTPFVMPLEVSPNAAVAFRGQPIAADGPRVIARDGHFYVGDQRFRAWGVNLNGGACFPTKDRAERMAARLEAAGVNAVRLHHMDNQWTKFPDSIWDPADPAKMSAEALDRLDYFVDQLARRGIYSNLNLHVSRTHSAQLGLPQSKATGNYDKMVDLFTPQLIAAQKDYAKQLLTRVNKHRGISYAADPAIAFVEINNENSLFMWDYPAKLKAMDPFYADVLRRQFNDWLKSRYGGSEKLAAAWNAGDSAAESPETLPPFKLVANGGAGATAGEIPGGVRLAIASAGKATWNIEYLAAPLSIRHDRYYTLRFRARADAARNVLARIGKHGPPYTVLGLRQNVKLTPEWKEFQLGFQSQRDEASAALSFQAGGSDVAVGIADVSLQSRPLTGLQDSERVEDGAVAFNLDGESKPRLHDRLRFMADTEKAYYDGFYAFLKNDLGCKSLVTGTMVYGPLGLWTQSGMDYLDTHAYWAHPTFPGGAWSDTAWTIDQKSQTDSPPLASKLAEIAAARLAGKPFTVSEYNHPAPNDYQAEAVPMIAGYAAAQDWDGVWMFAYSSTSAESGGAITGWFDIESNPAKWAFMPTGAAIFREAGLAPLGKATVVPLTDPVALQAGNGAMLIDTLNNALNLSETALTQSRLYVSLAPTTVADLPDAGTTLQWGDGRFSMTGPSARLFTTMKPKFSVVTAAAMDGKPLADSGRVLFTVGGRVENVGMGFSPDRRTLGKAWGAGPVQIEKQSAEFDFDRRPGLSVFSLKPDATLGEPIPQANAGKITFPDTAGTMLFLLKEP